MFHKQNKTNAKRETETLKMAAAPTYEIPRSVATNNFFSPVKDAETGNEGNSTRTPGTNESTDKGKPPPIVFTSEANLGRPHTGMRQDM
jgi:hypothetical protein